MLSARWSTTSSPMEQECQQALQAGRPINDFSHIVPEYARSSAPRDSPAEMVGTLCNSTCAPVACSQNRRLQMHSQKKQQQELRKSALLKLAKMEPEKRKRLLRIETLRRGLPAKKG